MSNRLQAVASNPYEGVEDLARFSDRVALARYRDGLLSKTAEQAAFVRRHCPELRDVIEPCCGNGRLLVALAPTCKHLTGFDVAASRVAFARRWADDLGLGNVHMYEDDAIEPRCPFPQAQADAVICITGAFGYFDALSPGSDLAITNRFAAALRPGGTLILELYRHPAIVGRCRADSNQTYRTWYELPPEDPFRFYLSHYRLDRNGQVLTHAKTFVARNGEIDEGRVEALRLYGPLDVERVLGRSFESVTLFRSWQDDPFEDEADKLIVCARRAR